LAGFFAVEAAVRERGTASSLAASNDDQDGTSRIVVASVLAASLSPLLRRVPLPSLPRSTAPAGLALQAAGLAVRIWSMRTLRASYSRTLRAEAEQPVVDRGRSRPMATRSARSSSCVAGGEHLLTLPFARSSAGPRS